MKFLKKYFLSRVEKGSFIGTHDIRSMYLHVSLHEDAVKYYGFSVKDENGVTRHYVYLVIPFGYNNATNIMSDLLCPIKVYLHSLSIDCSWYVDDGGNIGLSLKRASSYQNHTFFTLSLTGWELAEEKTSLPSTSVLYLGFILNTLEMTVSAPIKKIIRLQADIDHIIAANRFQVEIPCKQMASALGMCAHLIYSHGEVIKICTRESQHQMGQKVVESSWNSDMAVTDRMVKELKYCKEVLTSYNGRPIRYEHKHTTIVKPVHKSYLLTEWNPKDDDRKLITMVSDASETTAYVFQADSLKVVKEYPFDLSTSQASSTLRELTAIYRLFTEDEGFLQDNQHKMILWLTDSQVLCHIMRRGSRVLELQERVLEIYELQHKWGKFWI